MLKNKLLPAIDIVAQALRSREVSKRKLIVAVASGVSVLGVLTAVATVPAEAPVFAEEHVEAIQLAPLSLSDSADDVYWYEARFGSGDTFAAFLDRLQVDVAEIGAVVRDRTAMAVLRLLRPGTQVQAQVTADGVLRSLSFVTSRDSLVALERTASGFKTIDRRLKLNREIVARAASVRSSLFAAADSSGIPDSIARQLDTVFGGEIDFSRGFRRGDRFTVVYEMLYYQGRLIRPGRLLAAEVVHEGQVRRAAWFEQGETHGYFTPEGESLKQEFLRSPLEVSRITSGFEQRVNPLSRTWQAHKGIDYAAPIGTPVRATGDGTVEFVGSRSGYGNVIVLRHRGGYSTLYAHLNDFAEGLKQGSRVAQGEVIGGVGRTGWATGPHLHYEFRVRNEHVDPRTVALPGSTPIDSRQLANFRAQLAPLTARLDLLRSTTLAAME